jgi:hypothetical protein
MESRWVVFKVGEFTEHVEVLEHRAPARLVRVDFDGCYSWALDVQRTGEEEPFDVAHDCVDAMMEAYTAVLGRQPDEKLTTRWADALEVFWSNGVTA